MDTSYLLIDNTQDTFAAILANIKKAKISIKLQLFTFEGDSIGLQVSKLLIAKALSGVKVQVMIDDFTNWKINDKWMFLPRIRTTKKMRFHLLELINTQKMIKEMKDAGVKIVISNRLNFLTPRKSLTNRCHKKLLIIDGEVALTGGFNLSEHNYSWHDTFTQITDPDTVSELSKIFYDKFHNDFTEKEVIRVKENEIFQYTAPLMNRINELVSQAKEFIYIESPYFADKNLMKLLKKKDEEGVSVQIILPKINNSLYIQRIHRKYMQKYTKLITVRRKPTEMMHAKHILIDNYAIFGSSNFLNTPFLDNHEELSIITTNKEYIKSLKEYFLNSIKINNRE